MSKSITLNDKVILVTGAFGLIGTEISTHFLQEGAQVVLADNNESQLKAIEAEFSKKFPASQFLSIHLDITDEVSAENVIKRTVEVFGKLDVLINNAAIDAKFDKQNHGNVNPSRFE